MVERGIAEASKERPSTKVIRRLMRTTFPRRRKWIVEASPSVPSVLESYPALKTTKYVSIMLAIHDNHEYILLCVVLYSCGESSLPSLENNVKKLLDVTG